MSKKRCRKCNGLIFHEKVTDDDIWIIQEYCMSCGTRYDMVDSNFFISSEEVKRKKSIAIPDIRAKDTLDFSNKYNSLLRPVNAEIVEKLKELKKQFSIRFIAAYCDEDPTVIKLILSGNLLEIHKDLYDQLDLLYRDLSTSWDEVPSDPKTWTACTTKNCIHTSICNRKKVKPYGERMCINPKPVRHVNGVCKFLLR